MTDTHTGNDDRGGDTSSTRPPLSTPEGADLPTGRVREVESLVTEWLHDADVPGASLVVVDAEGVRYAAGFGARDMERNAPATPDTLYAMGSISKPVTSLAVLQLVEDGRLSVEDPVNEYVDHFADAPGDPITVGELLSHTSGMPATNPGYEDQRVEGRPSGVADRADFERFVRDSTEFRVTGEDRHLYYNDGYNVLGRVIEAVDGRRYAEYVDEEIFGPLDMERSTFDRGPVEADDDVITGYLPGEDGDGLEAVEIPLEELNNPCGGLVSSAREMTRFLRAMTTDGELDGARVCSPDAVERLQRPRATTDTFLDGTESSYGFGWGREPLGDDEVLGHGGGYTGATAFAGALDDAGLGVVVACNTTPSRHPMEVGKAILAVLAGTDPTAVPTVALREKCQAVTGTYEMFRRPATVTVEREEGGIAVEFSMPDGDWRAVAYPSSLDPDDNEFYWVDTGGVRNSIEFDLSGDRADMYFGRHRCRREQPGE